MKKNEDQRPADDKEKLKNLQELRLKLGWSNEPYVYTPRPEVSIDILKEAYPDRDLTNEEELIRTRREYNVTQSLGAIAKSGNANVNELLTVVEEMREAGTLAEFMENLKKKEEGNQ